MSHDRIHDCLDGAIARETLDADEQRRLAAIEATLRDASATLRASSGPDLTEMVMARVTQIDHSVPIVSGGIAGLLRWFWRPIAISFRPAYALVAVAATLATVLLVPPLPSGTSAAPMAIDAGADSRMYVQFRIEVPGASQVAVAGSFTDWQPEYDLTEVSPGVWSAMVPLGPGVYDYTFVVDGGRMLIDPYAPQVRDSFGGNNSRLFLPAPNGTA